MCACIGNTVREHIIFYSRNKIQSIGVFLFLPFLLLLSSVAAFSWSWNWRNLYIFTCTIFNVKRNNENGMCVLMCLVMKICKVKLENLLTLANFFEFLVSYSHKKLCCFAWWCVYHVKYEIWKIFSHHHLMSQTKLFQNSLHIFYRKKLENVRGGWGEIPTEFLILR